MAFWKKYLLKDHIKDIYAFSFILFLAFFYVSPGIFSSTQTTGALEHIYQWSPWTLSQRQQSSDTPNELLNDQILQFIPWREFAVENLRKGTIPLWNPYQYCGSPFLGNSQSSPFYPVNLLTLFLNIHWYLIISAFMKLFIAGTGMYVFLRTLTLSRISSLWGGIIFMFFGFNILWLGHPHTQSFIWTPWILANLVRWDRKLDLISFGLMSLLLGISFLGGHPETLLIVGSIYGFYSIFLYFFSGDLSQKGKFLAGVLGALIIGGCIASIQFLPFLDYLTQGTALTERLTMKPSTDYQGRRALITWLIPDFFGNPLLNSSWVKDEFFFQFNYAEAVSGYIGLLPLLMLTGLVFIKKTYRPIIFWSLLAIAGFIVAYKFPIIGPLATKIPGLSLIHPKRLVILSSFSLIILSSFGLESFLAPELTWKEKKSLLFLIGTLSLLGIISTIPVSGGFSLASQFLGLAAKSITRLPMEQVLTIIQQGLNTFTYHILLALIALSALLWFKSFRSMKMMIILFCLAAELLHFGWKYNTGDSVAQFPPDHSLKMFFARDPSLYRIISLDEWTLYPPNTAMLDKVYDVRGYDAINPKTYETYFRLLGLGFWKDPGQRLWTDSPNLNSNSLKLLGMMNVKYILSRKALVIPNTQRVFHTGDLWIYQNNKFLPRAFFVTDTLSADIESTRKYYFISDDFLPDRTIILDIPAKLENSSLPQKLPSQVKVRYLDTNTIEADIECPSKGFLFISENYDKGWKATINGRKTNLLRANGCFMAIPVPPGKSTVHLKYSPLSFKIGGILCLAGLFISLLLTGAGIRRRFSKIPWGN